MSAVKGAWAKGSIVKQMADTEATIVKQEKQRAIKQAEQRARSLEEEKILRKLKEMRDLLNEPRGRRSSCPSLLAYCYKKNQIFTGYSATGAPQFVKKGTIVDEITVVLRQFFPDNLEKLDITEEKVVSRVVELLAELYRKELVNDSKKEQQWRKERGIRLKSQFGTPCVEAWMEGKPEERAYASAEYRESIKTMDFDRLLDECVTNKLLKLSIM
jgi:hypothetical protein